MADERAQIESDQRPLVLASASPRRRELLAVLGVQFTVAPADIDETPHPGEAPAALVRRLAEGKAAALASPGKVVLAADTIVVLDDEILGKPAGQTDGVAMLARLSGRTHKVLTGVCVRADPDCGGVQLEVVETAVTFRAIESREAEAYWHTGEPADKAGGYGLQGRGGVFVRRIEGSVSNVIGLPLTETEAMLRRAGIDVWRQV